MKLTAKKNDGVSPVIGTILLVAITVALVAIISAVVMGMAGGIGSSYVVGVTVTENASSTTGDALVTITGGQDAGKLTAFYVYNGAITPIYTQSNPVVGVPYNAPVGTGSKTVSVVGQFKDGTNQTIYSATVNY